MSAELERCKKALEVAARGIAQGGCVLGDPKCHCRSCELLRQIDAILNPLPEMEEVEVVRWECVNCGHVLRGLRNPEDAPDYNYCCKRDVGFIRLTGSYQRPVPRKVGRSAKVRFHPSPASTFCYVDGDAMPNSEFVADIVWEE